MKKNILLFLTCYIIAMLSILLLILVVYVYETITVGYAWESEIDKTFKAVSIGGIPIGVGYFLLYKAFNQK